jgi:hypothetical protein
MSSSHQISFVNQRKPYRKPHLEELGDLRTLTLGGSPGVTDSGSAGIRRPPSSRIRQLDGFPSPLPDGSIVLPDGSILPPGKQPWP